MDPLHALADIASIATGVVAVLAFGSYRWTIRRRMRKVETLLKAKVVERRTGSDGGSLTAEQLAAYGNLTETQVIEATSRSSKIESYEGTDGRHRYRWIAR
jgi:molybdenum-dependent DNA-binding transcriptional regulator ModE